VHKKALFLLKNCKNRPALGTLASYPRWPPAVEGSAPDPRKKKH